MTKKHSDAETSKFEEKVKKLEKTNEHLLAQNVKGTKTNQTLLASEKKYQSLIESSDDPIYLVDRELKYLYANKKLLSRYGKSLSEVTGQSYANFHSPEATELFSNRVKEVLKSGKPVAYEYKSQRDGKDFLRTLNPFVNRKTGEIAAITVISKDITKQKQSEERIKHLNRILLAVRNVNQLITKENDRGSLIEKACGLLVETRGYLDVWIAILDEKGKMTKYANAGNSEYISKISEILKSGKITPCGIESLKRSEITITKPGQPICSGCPVFDYDIDKGVMTIPLKYENKIYGVAAATVPAEMLTDEEEQSLFTEVTGDIAFALWKMEMEEEKHKLKEIESSILYSVPFAVIGLHERQIIFANESVKDVFGWEAAKLIGKKSRILYRSDEEYEKIADLFYPVLEKQQTHSEEFPCRRKDGKDIICMISAARIGESLKEGEIVVTYTDITERKRAEEALRDSEENFKNIFHFVPESLLAVNDKIEVLNSNKAFEKLICKYAPELDMSEKELRKKIISELRKRFGKTNHGLIEIRKTAEK
ncbi:MAG: PAS domain S-box protein [Candidatus Marinimicrobia bacterium]|nr:PAS domain S-box protein [Candidatus Neomarinimicrobiota bacterium]